MTDTNRIQHQQAINLAHDERRPFCFKAAWFIIPYYTKEIRSNEEAQFARSNAVHHADVQPNTHH